MNKYLKLFITCFIIAGAFICSGVTVLIVWNIVRKFLFALGILPQ